MRVVVRTLLLSLLAGVALTPALAQDNMGYVPMAKAKFGNLPVLPKCATIAVVSGDPSKEAAVIMAKTAAGCVIPWHWHTASEELMFVSGSAKVDMKEGAPARMHAGDYLHLPAKNVHQFSCVAACTFFLVTDGAFDIHYVGASGKEISMDEALKAKAKAPAKKAPAKGDMKDMKM
jgi:quercetin dioxygenase-like cupin family protein